MIKPRILVLSGYGLNCEEETAFGFKLAGGQADIVHLNDLISGRKSLKNYQIMAIPGGFSHGDDTGSGSAYANRIKNNLWEKINLFVQKDSLVIGICNGFQIMTNLGLLGPLALTHNDSARYTVRWVDLKVKNKTPWLKGIRAIPLPIAHGEGKFFASTKILGQLEKSGLIALRYTEGEMCQYQNLKPNPNGSLKNIAGITDETGRLFGLMPHPERAVFLHHLPNWPLLKEQYKRAGKRLPKFGPGLQIFKNGVDYFK